MRKTILVVGARSTLAQVVIPQLAERNNIITAGRVDCDIYCDITKDVTLPEGVDVVINFAASFGGASDEAILQAVDTNVVGIVRLCMAVKAAKIQHLINISSIFALLDESSPGYSSYAITKRQGDELAEFYCNQHNLPITILRPSRIYGDSQDFAKHQPFLYHLIENARSGQDIKLYGTHDASRNYLHAQDLAVIIDEIISKKIEGIHDCVYPTNETYSRIAQSAQQVFGKGGDIGFIEEKSDIVDDTFPLDTSLYEKIDFQPNISIEDGLRRIKKHMEEGSV
jgi:nucleoside-diphosphate-sugar epimerase